MTDELLNTLADTVLVQTTTIKELMDICTMLKDRIEVLEAKVDK